MAAKRKTKRTTSKKKVVKAKPTTYHGELNSLLTFAFTIACIGAMLFALYLVMRGLMY